MRKKEREITDIAAIESIIQRADVCRIALADGNIPYIVTMNFGYSGGEEKCLYFPGLRYDQRESLYLFPYYHFPSFLSAGVCPACAKKYKSEMEGLRTLEKETNAFLLQEVYGQGKKNITRKLHQVRKETYEVIEESREIWKKIRQKE